MVYFLNGLLCWNMLRVICLLSFVRHSKFQCQMIKRWSSTIFPLEQIIGLAKGKLVVKSLKVVPPGLVLNWGQGWATGKLCCWASLWCCLHSGLGFQTTLWLVARSCACSSWIYLYQGRLIKFGLIFLTKFAQIDLNQNFRRFWLTLSLLIIWEIEWGVFGWEAQ